jgi:transcriptional regulator with XRE-family HTH domain
MTESFEDTLGRRIKAARMQRGVNQAELARALGISANAMVDIEKDRSYPRADRLINIMEVLQVTGNYLLGYKEPDQLESIKPVTKTKRREARKRKTLNE